MPQDNKTWLEISRVVAKAFIEESFIKEASLFDVYWDMFSSRMNERLLESHGDLPSFEESQKVVSEIHFAQSSAVDLVTPIILATVAETISTINTKKLSGSKLEKFIGDTAARFGAQPGLAATLLKHLPILCQEALGGKSDGTVSTPPNNQFKIWTNGESKVVPSIDEYEKRKDNYLFWIDLNEKTHISKFNASRKLSPRSIQLLKCLVEKLGTPIPVGKILTDAFEDPSSMPIETDEGKIDQQLSKLNQFCGEQFRQYLFAKWFRNGLGLKDSFADKYFLFSRCR
jgi:hypothetical protein